MFEKVVIDWNIHVYILQNGGGGSVKTICENNHRLGVVFFEGVLKIPVKRASVIETCQKNKTRGRDSLAHNDSNTAQTNANRRPAGKTPLTLSYIRMQGGLKHL